MKLRPIRDQVIVRLDKEPDSTDAGLTIPWIAQTRSTWGVVLGAGPGVVNKKGRFIPVTVKPKDRVSCPWKAGVDFQDGECELKILRESEIVAVEEYIG